MALKPLSPSPAKTAAGRPAAAERGASSCLAAVISAIILLMPANAALAAGHKTDMKNKSLNSKEVPVIVTAKTLFADNKTKVVTYKKDVVVKKGDVTLYADEVIINLKKDGNTSKQKSADDVFQGSGKIDTIVAKGNVKIVQQDKTATSDEATYYSNSDKFIMTGRPRVWQGDNVLTGNRISYNIKDDTFQAEEAKTVLYQQGEETGTVPQGETGSAEGKPEAAPKGSKPGLPKSSKGINIP